MSLYSTFATIDWQDEETALHFAQSLFREHGISSQRLGCTTYTDFANKSERIAFRRVARMYGKTL